MAQSPEFTSIADHLYKVASDVFLLYPEKPIVSHGVKIQAERDLLINDEYTVRNGCGRLDHIHKDDIVGCLVQAKDLHIDPKILRDDMKLQAEDYLLLLLQQQ